MCNFWSAIVSRTGKVYHLGEIVSHEKTIERFKLKDKNDNICRVEIVPKNKLEYLKPINDKNWVFKIDQEKPSWWDVKYEGKCWKRFSDWMKSKEGRNFRRKFRRIKKWADPMTSKTGEQHIYRTRMTKQIKKMVEAYYQKPNSVSDSVSDSVRDSVSDSIWDSVWDSVRASIWDSIWASIWASVSDSIRDSVWASVRDSVWDSVWASVLYSLGTFLGNKEVVKLKLPADIFKAGIVHAKINDEIYVWGKRGKLLDKWKVSE